MKDTLQTYKDNIEKNIRIQQEEDREAEGEEKKAPQEKFPVDHDKIKAIASLFDDYNNIIGKNYSAYGTYDDFQFAKTRSGDIVEERLEGFFKNHFAGDYILKNTFEASALQRIFYLE